ncbi:hypothetical protein [Nocardioides sp. AE5]|uniref:hypothetical protein n=1 Tax=Nocardioides sp. AE5 TaxID=2962573 RepID=UPI002881D64B|nr:hypothetical protein [Nocardioides sp. AE5]MDT0201958.1 hypothetical protein [Nocardioides sp. AE5]
MTVRDQDQVRARIVTWLRSVLVLCGVFALIRWISDEEPTWALLGALLATTVGLVVWQVAARTVTLKVGRDGIRVTGRRLTWSEVRSITVLPGQVRLHVEGERSLPAGSKGRIIDPDADNSEQIVIAVPDERGDDVARAIREHAPDSVRLSGIGA